MNNKNSAKISKRYAKSLVEMMMTDEFKSDELITNLKNAENILKSSDELYSVMLNPVISASDKEGIIESVFEKDCILPVRSFLKLLIEKNRFSLVFLIIEEFTKLINKINNIAQIDVTSAIELEKARKEEIQNKLNEKLNKKIEINYAVDEDIIAGLIFKIEDDVLDTSFRRKIEDLKKELL